MKLDLSALTVNEIRQRYLRCPGPVSSRLAGEMARDARSAVRQMGHTLQRVRERRRLERKRLAGLLELEKGLHKKGFSRIAGVDEAGIGPLAGPVVAAAVVFPPGTWIEEVDDSKRLDSRKRLALARSIRRRAAAVGLGVAEVAEIQRLNVYWAGILCMRRAVENLPFRPDHLLIDARSIPDLPIPQLAVTGGDAAHFSIAAASIIAKTYRDHLMEGLDRRYPMYGFAKHKGYCTREHQQAIRTHGICSAHRSSYPFVEELTGRYSSGYYSLKMRLEPNCSLDALEAFWRDFVALGPRLSPPERQKLKLLFRSRRRALMRESQLSFLA